MALQFGVNPQKLGECRYMITINNFDFENYDTNAQKLIKKGFDYALELIERQDRSIVDINQDYKFLSSAEVNKIIDDVKKSVLTSEELKMKKIDYSNRTSDFNYFLMQLLERENDFIVKLAENNKTLCKSLDISNYTFKADEV